MRLSIVHARVDVEDFWRPRLLLKLDGSVLVPGLYAFRLATREPTYATLRLALGNRAHVPMPVFLERVGPCLYARSFSLAEPVAELELELEPQLDPDVVRSAEIVPLKLWDLAVGRGGWLLKQLTAPRMLLAKVRQVVRGRSNLSFSGVGGRTVAPETIYAAWRRAFEGQAEDARVASELGRLSQGRMFTLLMVFLTSSGAFDELRDMLGRARACDGQVRLAFIVIDNDAGGLPGDVRALLEAAGGRVAECAGSTLPLQLIDDEAQRIGAQAFAYVERGRRWSTRAAGYVGVQMLRDVRCLAITGDADRQLADGARVQPDFLPAWSPAKQHASDCMRGAVAFRAGAELVTHSGTACDAASGGRLLEAFARGDRRVAHIPRVLMHWRDKAKPGRERAHEDRSAPPGPVARPSISVIIPTKNRPDLLRKAVRSALAGSEAMLEVVVVDNGPAGRSPAEMLGELSTDARVRIVNDDRVFNFSALINAGRRHCRGDILVLLNDDTECDGTGWLDRLAVLAADPHAGCIGALLLYPSGRIQHGGVVLGIHGLAGHALRHLLPGDTPARHRLAGVHEVSAVTGACLAVRAALFDEMGGLDEALPYTLNDIDFCLRVRARGYPNLMAPHVRLAHHESATRGLDVGPEREARLARETERFFAKWGPGVLRDPCYSPHLTLAREDCGPRDI